MMKKIVLGSFISLASLGVVHAQDLSPQEINSVNLSSLLSDKRLEHLPTDKPDPAVIHLQVLLDRAGASPGVIDGLDGANVRKAIAGFELLQGLPVDGKLDEEVVARLSDDKGVVGPYIISPDDGDDIVA